MSISMTAWLAYAAPLAGCVLIALLGFGGERVPRRVASWIACGVMLAAFALSVIVFVRLHGLDEESRSIHSVAWTWLQSGTFHVRISPDAARTLKDGDTATIGITDYAQSQLGDVVFVELPKTGRRLKKAEAAAVVESVKAASDVYAPITGEVTEINEALVADPALVNSDAAGKAWFFKMKIADKSELEGLMDEAAYQKHTA